MLIRIYNMMNKQLLTYITPRLSILRIDKKQSAQKYLQAQLQIKCRHKNYFHIFNLSSYNFSDGALPHTNFKWRGIPYSLTETVRILASLEMYQCRNGANAAVIAVDEELGYGFACFVIDIYLGILATDNRNRLCSNDHALAEFYKIYKQIDISNPPIKIIDSFSFKNEQECFIPIVKIFNESRHNNFEQLHLHNPQEELACYYLDRKKPLAQGIGLKYCDRKPETKHFSKPVIVFGDVKLEIYSYTSLKYQLQFVCGFNTKAMEYEQSIVQLQAEDLFDVTNLGKICKMGEVVIQVSDYCDRCKDQPTCSDCLELIKKLGNTYTSAQMELEKICKNRTKQETMRITR